MESIYKCNSKEYWDWRYKNNWDEYLGSEQTLYFANILINNLPQDIYNEFISNNYDYLDFGCGKGQLCGLVSEVFRTDRVLGVDLSTEAIKQAEKLYPNLSFCDKEVTKQYKIDNIITSNTLEHLYDWKEYLELFSFIAQKYVIILVPYKSCIFDEHVISFDENSFPDNVKDLTKISQQSIDCNDERYWVGGQMLVIYKKNGQE